MTTNVPHDVWMLSEIRLEGQRRVVEMGWCVNTVQEFTTNVIPVLKRILSRFEVAGAHDWDAIARNLTHEFGFEHSHAVGILSGPFEDRKSIMALLQVARDKIRGDEGRSVTLLWSPELLDALKQAVRFTRTVDPN